MHPSHIHGRSPVRKTHPCIALPTRHKRTTLPTRLPVRETHTHTTLPTRPHRWQVTGQGNTHAHNPAYKTAQVAGRRSGKHTRTQPCLQDRRGGRSPVRETHTHTTLPTRPHRWQVAGHGNTHAQPCLQDRTGGRSPVRETHTHITLPTRPHRWQVACQRNTHAQPCLQDRTGGRSPVRETHTHTYTQPWL